MRSWILISLLAILGATVAFAEGPRPSRKAREEAKQHFLVGKKLYEEGKYAEAIVEFQQANDLAPSPKVLFNIAQAYRLLGEKLNARSYYEQYLAAESSGQIADEARSHVEALTQAIARDEEELKKREEEARRLEEERKRAEEERQRLEEERRQAEELARQRAAEEEQRRHAAEEERRRIDEERRRIEEERRRRARPSTMKQVLRWGGLGVAVLGGGVFTYGVYKGTEARRIEQDLEAEVAMNMQYPDDIVGRIQYGNRAESRAIFGLIGGAIGILGGGTLFYLGGRVDVEPALDGSALGAVLKGSF